MNQRRIRIGVFESPPLMWSEDNGRFTGPLIALADLLVKENQWDPVFVQCLTEHLASPTVVEWEVGLGLFGSTRRNDKLWFSAPIFSTNLILAAPSSRQLNAQGCTLIAKIGDISSDFVDAAKRCRPECALKLIPAKSPFSPIQMSAVVENSIAITDRISVASLNKTTTQPKFMEILSVCEIVMSVAIPTRCSDLMELISHQITFSRLSTDFYSNIDLENLAKFGVKPVFPEDSTVFSSSGVPLEAKDRSDFRRNF